MTARAGAVLALLLLGAACGSPTGSPGPSQSAAASLNGSPSGAPSGGPSVEPTASEELPAFVCDLPITGEGSIAIAHTADVRVGTHDGYDRVVFEYLENGTPDYRIQRAIPPYTKDPSDLPLTVLGSNVLEIVLVGGTKMADDGSSTYTGPTNFLRDYVQLAQLVERGDFEAINSWYLGLNGSECLRAFVLSEPSRIVIDIEH